MTFFSCAPTRSILKSFDDEGLGVGDEASLDGGGDERERERNKNVQQSRSISTLLSQKYFIHSLLSKDRTGVSIFHICGLNEKTTNELTKAYQSQIVSIALIGYLGQL